MEPTINRQAFSVCRCIFEQNFEIPADTEAVLPDYCPDAARILKTTATAGVTSRRFTQNGLEIEGIMHITVIYSDAESSELHSYEITKSFEQTIEIGDTTGELTADTVTAADRISCRMLTPRKLDIHSTISMGVKVFATEEHETVCSAENLGLQSKCESESSLEVLYCGEKYINVSDEIEIDPSMKPVRCIIRSELGVLNAECRLVGEKAIAKGDVTLGILYSTDTPMRLEKLETAIPFSQIIDIPSMDDGYEPVYSFRICSYEIRPRTGMDGECHSLAVSVRVGVSLSVSKSSEVKVITDAYSTLYDLDIGREKTSCRIQNGTVDDTINCKATVQLPDEAAAVLDVWCENDAPIAKTSGGKKILNGSVRVCILLSDGDGNPMYAETTSDYTYECDSIAQNDELKASVKAEASGYNITSKNSAEVNLKMHISGEVYKVREFSFVSSITVNGEKDKSKTPPLILCRTDAGEALWDIARRYSTTEDALRSANGITSDVLEKSVMLLIPGV